MLILRIFPFLIAIIFSFSIAIAQDKENTPGEKQKQAIAYLNKLLTETKGLKLAENRALIYARAGSLLWQLDEKRARLLFQDSIGELINAQYFAEGMKKNQNQYYGLLTGSDFRPQILNLIAAKDAEMALDNLIKTRPLRVQKAMAASKRNSKEDSPKWGFDGYGGSNESYLAANELNLEQSFIAQAANQKPELTIELVRKSLKKGISYQSLDLLRKAFAKDQEAANALAGEALEKMISADFSSDGNTANLSFYFLQEYTREKNRQEKHLRLEENLIKTLANKYLDHLLENSGGRRGDSMRYYLPTIEKILPGRAAGIREKYAKKAGNDYEAENLAYSKLMEKNPGPDVLISEAGKFKTHIRLQILQAAAGKLAENGDFAQAREVLSASLSDEAREQALSSLNQQMASTAISKGKFDEALELIELLPDDAKVNSLVSMANTIYQKNPEENKQYATSILERCFNFISEAPETQQELWPISSLIQAYAEIEPNRAISIADSLLRKLNEIAEARIIVDRFNGSGSIRDGEILISQTYSYNFPVLDPPLQVLARKNMERVFGLTDAIQRTELRISAQLSIAEQNAEFFRPLAGPESRGK